MYEARQNKEKVSRRIDGGMARQKVQIINKRNNAIQRTYQGKVNVFDGELYMITKNNLYTGTETTPYTRDYVNSLPDQPYEIHFDYNFDKDSAEKAAYKVINSNNYFWVNNPKSFINNSRATERKALMRFSHPFRNFLFLSFEMNLLSL